MTADERWTDSPELQQPATRGDIHRLRSEVNNLTATLSVRLGDVDRRLTVLEVEARPVLPPLEMGRRLEQIDEMTKAVQALTTVAEGNRRRIWMAMGALSVVVVVGELLIRQL